jgi:hypothetical protein
MERREMPNAPQLGCPLRLDGLKQLAIKLHGIWEMPKAVLSNSIGESQTRPFNDHILPEEILNSKKKKEYFFNIYIFKIYVKMQGIFLLCFSVLI